MKRPIDRIVSLMVDVVNARRTCASICEAEVEAQRGVPESLEKVRVSLNGALEALGQSVPEVVLRDVYSEAQPRVVVPRRTRQRGGDLRR